MRGVGGGNRGGSGRVVRSAQAVAAGHAGSRASSHAGSLCRHQGRAQRVRGRRARPRAGARPCRPATAAATTVTTAAVAEQVRQVQQV